MATASAPTATTSSQPGYFTAPLPPNSAAAEFYRENGFLVVENALSAVEVAALNADAAAICRGDYGPIQGSRPRPPTHPARTTKSSRASCASIFRTKSLR